MWVNSGHILGAQLFPGSISVGILVGLELAEPRLLHLEFLFQHDSKYGLPSLSLSQEKESPFCKNFQVF